MTEQRAKISLLRPIVLADKRRVTLEIIVDNLPSTAANIMFMPDLADSPLTGPPQPDIEAGSPYPNLELSILNSRRQQIASLFIVEHKERDIALTLHLTSPDLQEQYIARAEMTFADEIIDVVEIPFWLSQTG